jgi:hypothetical protein
MFSGFLRCIPAVQEYYTKPQILQVKMSSILGYNLVKLKSNGTVAEVIDFRCSSATVADVMDCRG